MNTNETILGWRDCYAENGKPVKCWKCGCTEQREEVRSMVDVLYGQGPVCEYEVFCAKCGTGIGYWAYGSFDSRYMRDMMANVQGQRGDDGLIVGDSAAP